MDNQDFTVTITVDQSPEEAFTAINNVRGWWTENLEGQCEQVDDEFEVRFGDVHYSKHKLTELEPGKKVAWLITDSKLSFVEQQDEWVGTKIIFDIERKDGTTQIRFTQKGLVPAIACYKNCANAWSGYITGSLRNLIATGEGNPTKK